AAADGRRAVRLFGALTAFFSRKEPGTALALVRILAGLAAVLSLEGVWRAGLVRMIWVDDDLGGYRDLRGEWLVQLLGGPSEPVMTGLTLAGIAAGLVLML